MMPDFFFMTTGNFSFGMPFQRHFLPASLGCVIASAKFSNLIGNRNQKIYLSTGLLSRRFICPDLFHPQPL